jgi:hypothetical protein
MMITAIFKFRAAVAPLKIQETDFADQCQHHFPSQSSRSSANASHAQWSPPRPCELFFIFEN